MYGFWKKIRCSGGKFSFSSLKGETLTNINPIFSDYVKHFEVETTFYNLGFSLPVCIDLRIK